MLNKYIDHKMTMAIKAKEARKKAREEKKKLKEEMKMTEKDRRIRTKQPIQE